MVLQGISSNLGFATTTARHAQTALFEQGRSLLLMQAPWLTNYDKELTSFPGSRYDDQVDSTAQALAYLKSNHNIVIWERLGKDD